MPDIKHLSLIALVCLSAGCFQPQNQAQTVLVNSVPRLTAVVNQSLQAEPIGGGFVDHARFLASDFAGHKNIISKPVAGVVNHHVLAMDLLAEFFKSIKQSRPDIKTFIILSPDHLSRGHGISLSNLAYSTPAGTVEVKNDYFQSLKNLDYYDGTSARLFEDEHGVGALVPFIAREFPNADVVPVFLRSDISLKQARQLGQDLSLLVSGDSMLIISSDMSHALDSNKASARDRQTLEWLERMDFDYLIKATDANTDSGASFAVLAAYLADLDPEKQISDYAFQLLSHKSSVDYNQDPGNVTTYITGFWH